MESVAHKGKITNITPQLTTVEIISESACSACHAKGLCSMSESTKKFIEVPTRGWDNFEVGQEVNVVLKASMGHKAVWVAYVVPLIIMVVLLLTLLAVHAGELAAGLCAIAGVGLYYFAIWLLRGKLKNEYIFTIENKF